MTLWTIAAFFAGIGIGALGYAWWSRMPQAHDDAVEAICRELCDPSAEWALIEEGYRSNWLNVRTKGLMLREHRSDGEIRVDTPPIPRLTKRQTKRLRTALSEQRAYAVKRATGELPEPKLLQKELR